MGRPQRFRLWGLALFGGLLLAPGTGSAKQPKNASPPPGQSAADSEARSKELLKKHFPLEEDIGAIPIVRVPKVEEGKRPASAKLQPEKEKAKAAKAVVEPKEVPPPVAAPTPPPADKPIEKAPVAVVPKKVDPPKAGPALGSEDNRQIDDLLSRALTDSPTVAAADDPVEETLPPLGMAEIRQTMQTVQPEVKSNCRLGRLGVVLVKVVVDPNGQVASVAPEGKLAKAPLARCVVDHVKRARFPRSGGGSFQYTLTVL